MFLVGDMCNTMVSFIDVLNITCTIHILTWFSDPADWEGPGVPMPLHFVFCDSRTSKEEASTHTVMSLSFSSSNDTSMLTLWVSLSLQSRLIMATCNSHQISFFSWIKILLQFKILAVMQKHKFSLTWIRIIYKIYLQKKK